MTPIAQRIKTTSRPMLALTLLAALLGASPALGGQTFHSNQFGYRVTFPDGWVQIPSDVVSDLSAKTLRAPAGVTLKFEAAYQKPAERWFKYPYIMTQVIPYPNGRQPSESEVESIIRAQTGADINQLTKQNLNPQIAKLMSNAQSNRPQWDAQTKTLRQAIQMDFAGIGRVRGINVTRFGRTGMVSVASYAQDSDFDAEQPVFTKVADSFQFDPGSEYSNAFEMGRKAGALAVPLILLAVVVGIVLFVVRMARR